MWRSDKYAIWRCLAGWNVKQPCGGASSFGGEDGRSRGIVGRGMEWRTFGMKWRKSVCRFPRDVARVLALSSDVWRTCRLQTMCPPHIRGKERRRGYREVAYSLRNGRPKERNGMERTTIALSRETARPPHRTMKRRSWLLMGAAGAEMLMLWLMP